MAMAAKLDICERVHGKERERERTRRIGGRGKVVAPGSLSPRPGHQRWRASLREIVDGGQDTEVLHCAEEDDDSGGGLGLGWASGRKGRKGDGLALGPEQGGVPFFQ
jgi:hypothetical protein